jgi:hypothetical protein
MRELKYPAELRFFALDRTSAALLPVIATMVTQHSAAIVEHAVRQKQDVLPPLSSGLASRRTFLPAS